MTKLFAEQVNMLLPAGLQPLRHLHLFPVNNVDIIGRPGVVTLAVEVSPEVCPQFTDSMKQGSHHISIHADEVFQCSWVGQAGHGIDGEHKGTVFVAQADGPLKEPMIIRKRGK